MKSDNLKKTFPKQKEQYFADGGEVEDDDAPDVPVAPSTSLDPAPAPINPVVQQYLQNKQQLAQAQSEAGDNRLIAGLARAGGSLSRGLSHANTPEDKAGYDALDQSANQPVVDVTNAQKSQSQDLKNQQDLVSTKKAVADSDPTSQESRAKQQMIKRLYPGKFDDETIDQMSATDIGDSVLKPLELDEKIKEHGDEMRSKAADRASAAADRASGKATADQGKALNYVTSQLDSARGDSAVKQAQVDLYSTKKISSLIGLYGDPNQLTQQQVRLLADEVAKVATGGVPGEAGTEGITPNTLRGRMSTFVQNLINSPTPANAAEFVKQYKDYSGAVANDARSTIKSKIDSVIETHRNQIGEDNYQNVKKQYYTRYGLNDDAGAPDSSAQDHSSRAAAILAQRQAAKASQGTINQAMPDLSAPPPSGVPASLAAPGYANGGTVIPPNFQHVSAAPRMPIAIPHLPKAPKEVMPAGDKNMVRPAHFEHGGTVPGQPNVPFNSPVNDVVNAKLTPKEEVLPLSVTQSKTPALAAYLHMKSKGYK